MKRKALQALSKKHNLPANTTNLEMANSLHSLLKGSESMGGLRRRSKRNASKIQLSDEMLGKNEKRRTRSGKLVEEEEEEEEESGVSAMDSKSIIPGLPDEIARQCLIRLPYNWFRTAMAVSKVWKEEFDSPEFDRLRKVSGLCQHIVVLVQAEPNRGKFFVPPPFRFALYETSMGIVDWLPSVPGFPDGYPLYCKVACVRRNLVVVGGMSLSHLDISGMVFIYDFVATTWRCGARMPNPRDFFACASDGDRTVFIAGGIDGNNNVFKSSLAYDVMRDEWATLPDMATKRRYCKGIFHHGRFHVLGGYPKFNMEVFNVDTWQWGHIEEDVFACTAGMGMRMCMRTCLIGNDEKLYKCLDGHVAVRESGTWHSFVKLPDDVSGLQYMVTWEGKLFVTGLGLSGGPHVVYTLDLSEGMDYTWTKVVRPDDYSGEAKTGCVLEI